MPASCRQSSARYRVTRSKSGNAVCTSKWDRARLESSNTAKTVTIDGKELTIATITNGVAKKFPLRSADGSPLTPQEFNERLIVASLSAGGSEDAQAIVDGLPYFAGDDNQFSVLFDAAIEVNGLKKAADAGKADPEPTAE